MVHRWLVLFIFTLAAFSPQARRVKEAYFKRPSLPATSNRTAQGSSSVTAPDPDSNAMDQNSPSKIAGHHTKQSKATAKKLSAKKLVAQPKNAGGEVVGEEAVGEEGGGREMEDTEDLSVSQDRKAVAAAGESGQAGDAPAVTRAGPSKIAECLTKPFKKLAKKLKGPASLPVSDLFGALHDISKKGGGLEQCGFASAATELLLNVRKLSACPAGYTVNQCLQDETVRIKIENKKDRKDLANTLAHDDRPAILQDPSPAMGCIWSMRILGFIGEMLHKVARGGSLVDAGEQAYASRIAPAFSWWSPVALIVKRRILAELSEKATMAKVGGEDAGMHKLSENVKANMSEFSEVVLPLVNSIWDSIVAHKLDDSPTKRDSVPADRIGASGS